ncbi:epidermal differentiation-specific protein-like [Mobula birostris]|uniref:epidermal differentiation-specific protein-like n=1 Tax=Mobula birostris TaxID=1983395 RepID=UPI003B28940E
MLTGFRCLVVANNDWMLLVDNISLSHGGSEINFAAFQGVHKSLHCLRDLVNDTHLSIKMSKIILYDETDFNGSHKEFVDNISDLGTEIFSDTARSLKVQGQHWVAYTKTNFQGKFKVFGQGDHGSLGDMDQKIRSLRLVQEALKDPEIILYEDVGYKGRSRSIEETVNDLTRAGFDNLVSSHKVKQGVWILCQGKNQTGERLITFKGDEWRNYVDFSWNDKLSSIKALQTSDLEV